MTETKKEFRESPRRRRLPLVVDGLVFENPSQIGIWRVFYETLKRLAGRIDITLWLRAPAVQPVPPGVRVVSDGGRALVPKWNVPGRLCKRMGLVRQALGYRDLPKGAVFHSTYFTPSPSPDAAVVTSVYDVIAEAMYPLSGEGAAGRIAAKRDAILAATLCPAISQTTADDLKRFYPQMAGRERVVYLGTEHLISQSPTPASKEIAPGYVLFVGHRAGYKNFHTVLDALTRPAWPAEVVLHVVGPPLADYEWQLIGAMGIRNRIVDLGRLTDVQLQEQYARARGFVFPSLLEGFGLPLLEAHVNGCPVACSDIAVFREIAADAALFFDPRLGERLAEAVAVICEPGTRRRLVEAGHENARRFSWDRTAEQALAVYEEAAELASR